MKNLFLLSNLLWISIICFQACNTFKQVANSNLPTMATLNCPGCTDYAKNTSNSNPNAYGSTTGLSLATARKMSLNYQSNCQTKLNVNPLSGADARTAWFSLGTLKQFIFNIEKAACTNNCQDSLQLGVRIYYAQYPDFTTTTFLNGATSSNADDRNLYTDLHDVSTNYSKRHTLFMVPTFDQAINGNISNIAHIDFDPWHMGNSCSNPTRLTALPNDTKSMILSPDQPQYGKRIIQGKNVIGQGFTDNSLLQNHGNLYPPDNSTGADL